MLFLIFGVVFIGGWVEDYFLILIVMFFFVLSKFFSVFNDLVDVCFV